VRAVGEEEERRDRAGRTPVPVSGDRAVPRMAGITAVCARAQDRAAGVGTAVAPAGRTFRFSAHDGSDPVDTLLDLETLYHNRTVYQSVGNRAFGEARNRVRRAIERTVPFALLVHALIVAWFTLLGRDPADIDDRRVARYPGSRPAQPAADQIRDALAAGGAAAT
jgi:hypothetical protein